MEWLVPHIARIDNFCNRLETGQKTYLNISRDRATYYEQRAQLSRDYLHRVRESSDTDENNNMREIEEVDVLKTSDDGGSAFEMSPSQENSSGSSHSGRASPEIDLQGQIKRYNEIMQAKAKTLPVSVIVSDHTFTSSAPSPTSSITGSESSRLEGDMNNIGRPKSYNYKPAPMVRKSERRFINAEQKDQSYWERRKRNNAAAKKSRESRREKEIEVSRRCDALVKENEGMKFTIMNLQERNTQMENTMKIYKEILVKNNLI